MDFSEKVPLRLNGGAALKIIALLISKASMIGAH